MEYSPRCWCAHLIIPTTTKRAAWLVPSANEECAISHTVRCSNLELHSTRLWEARAKRVGEGVQSKILMYALENSNDLKTGSKVGAISKWKMRYIIHRKMLQSKAALKEMVKLYSAKSGKKCTVLDDAHRCCLVLETSSKEDAMSELKTLIRS